MKKRKRDRLYDFIGSIIHMAGYAMILVLLATYFDSFHIDDRHLYLYGITITLIIFFLNKTIKPVLVVLTIPITGLTLGIFYPCINWFILKLSDWIMGSHFQMTNLLTSFLLALLISGMSGLMEHVIIKPLVRSMKKHG